MYEARELKVLTRTATGLLWSYMILNAIAQTGSFYTDVLSGRTPGVLSLTDYLTLANILVLLVTSIVVLRWIYRASVNAHAAAPDLTITPGWAVGWYFVPIANLWKPFQAMKEIWLGSHFGANWEAGYTSDLLNWWWGLYILDSFIGNASWRLAATAPELSAELGLVDGVITIPLSLILIWIMRQVTEAQDVTRHAEVFA
jgi:hypothetical protein